MVHCLNRIHNEAHMKDFTKAFHNTDSYIINGDGQTIPIRFTVISKLEGDQVKYKASFCSHHEKQFVKKEGVKNAMDAPEWSFPLSDIDVDEDGTYTHTNITSAIMSDMVRHIDDMPRNHRRWFTDDCYGSDIRDEFMMHVAMEQLMAEFLAETS